MRTRVTNTAKSISSRIDVIDSENGKNFDMRFTQKINRVYRPSVKEWVEPREIELIKLEDVPLDEIVGKYRWIMNGNEQ